MSSNFSTVIPLSMLRCDYLSWYTMYCFVRERTEELETVYSVSRRNYEAPSFRPGMQAYFLLRAVLSTY